MTEAEQPGQPKHPIWVLLTPAGRSPRVLLLAAVTGLLTGAAVATFDQITGTLLGYVQRAPLAAQAVAPLAGLLLAAAILKWVGGRASPATADEYARNFHAHDQRLSLRAAPAKVLAAVATLGVGTPLGYEGPSIYMGAVIGSGLQRRFSRMFSRRDAKVLLVAGAAAGVAAIFKAPATGALFALEVPYQDDLARNMLLPALVGAAMSYVTFAALGTTTSPLLAIKGAPPFDLRDLGGALVIGLLAGIGARSFAALIRAAKRLSARLNSFAGASSAGIILGILIVVSRAISDEPLAIGPGYRAVRWATDPTHGVLLVAGLLLIRTLAVPVALAGGGVGGLFVPLVVEGALVGRLCGSLFGQPGSSLFPVIGIAAFLGAGYRVPLAALMFVAESTGRPEFVVPALIAAVAAQLLMGRASVSAYQQARQAGHLERRFQLPLTDVLRTDIATLAPDATVADFFNHLLVGPRRSSVAVVEQGRYVGMARLDELQNVAQEQWGVTTVGEIMRIDVAVASPRWTLRQALAGMEEADVDELAVVDADGRLVGIVSSSDILRLHELFGQANENRGDLGV